MLSYGGVCSLSSCVITGIYRLVMFVVKVEITSIGVGFKLIFGSMIE